MNLLDDNFTNNEEELYSLIERKISKRINNSKLELVNLLKKEFVFNRNEPVTAVALMKVIEKWSNNSKY